MHALVGPNGAGKTTLFNLLTGFLAPTSGRIKVHGEDITGQEPEQIAHRGVARSFQITSLFDQMTLREHVELALGLPDRHSFRFWRSTKGLHRSAAGDELLDQVGLTTWRPSRDAGLRAEARAGAGTGAGAGPAGDAARRAHRGDGDRGRRPHHRARPQVAAGRTVVFVDHNMHVVGSLADRVTVLQQGRVLAEGTYDEVRRDERVVTAYLGEPC